LSRWPSGLVRGPSLISAFEEMLFSSLPLILANDSPPIQIFESLISLNWWKRTSNVPSLVRLLQAFIHEAPHQLNAEWRLVSQLHSIVRLLISSPASAKCGSSLLASCIQDLPYHLIAPYLPIIWKDLYDQCLLLENSDRYFLTNMSLLENYDRYLYAYFWIPHIGLMTEDKEVKVTLHASTILLHDSLYPEALNFDRFARMLDKVVGVIAHDKMEVESEVLQMKTQRFLSCKVEVVLLD
jgi:exportin-2 (importin alpha re-exporter)